MTTFKNLDEICKVDDEFLLNNRNYENFIASLAKSKGINNLDILKEDKDCALLFKSKEKEVLEKHYYDVTNIKLNSNVPIIIQNNFTTVLNLLIYSYYYRSFDMIAKQHALITLESALGLQMELLFKKNNNNEKLSQEDNDIQEKAKTPACGLSCLLQCAVHSKLINLNNLKDENGEDIGIPLPYTEQQKSIGFNNNLEPVINEEIVKLSKDKIRLICMQRNQLAHDTKPHFPDGKIWTSICANLINQLFSEKNKLN
jgi:hypothetical protein